MKNTKSLFTRFSGFLFLFAILYILLGGLSTIGNGQEYPYFAQGIVLIAIAGMLALCQGLTILSARQPRADHSAFWAAAEWIFAAVILALSALLRIYVVRTIPMKPESDYKTYYEIALLLNRGTLIEEGVGYCDYVAIFPHVLGYSAFLAKMLQIFGSSVQTGQYVNVALAVACCFLCWRIARLLGGKISAMVVLAITAFWPSQILYNNFLASEYLFSFLLYLCIWLFLHITICYTPKSGKVSKGIPMYLLLGVLLGITSAVRPMGLIALIAMGICLVSSRMPIPIRPRNDLSVSARGMRSGWIRFACILLAYLLSSAFLTKCVSFTVDRDLAGGSASMGYNLLVGLNYDSYGGWNEADSAYLYDALEETGSAEQAQLACRDLALQRLKTDPKRLLDLFVHKFNVLWNNDDYGTTWNFIFLEQHGELTQPLTDQLYRIQNFNNIWYFVTAFFAGIGGLYLLRSRGHWADVLILLFLGTVGMHLFVENQNRYHFHTLYTLAILSGVGLSEMYQDNKYRLVQGRAHRRQRLEWHWEETFALERLKEAEAYANAQQTKNMQGYFDMEKALKNGNINVSVSKAYETEAQKEAVGVGSHE